ncbi:MAG: DUF418 domain-containing protein [Lentimicrobium sp.]|jgi:uncharacterized protein|nr:DUF418 domain-containing protein [Lentimicrobium sp.]
MKNVAAPVEPGGRIIILDILRGIAILGILMVNMKLFVHPMSSMMVKPEAESSVIGFIPDLLIRFFFEGKFYTLFAFLFGYGFWLFIQKQIVSGSIIPIFRRRLLILLLFGALHVLLLWAGDILFFYALFGFFLIPFRKTSDRKLIVWGAILILIPPLMVAFSGGMIALGSSMPEGKAAVDAALTESTAAIAELNQRAHLIYSMGSFKQIIGIRFEEWLTMLPAMIFFYPAVLGLFFFGVVAARKRRAEIHRSQLAFFKRVLPWSLMVGLLGEGFYTYSYFYANPMAPDGLTILASFAHAIGAPAMTLSYICIVVLLYLKGCFSGLCNALIPVGRMALTNYLMQSLICTSIFYGYGLGYYGKINTAQGLILGVIVFIFQVFFSRFWLSRFRFGPMEWLWRSLTYLKPQAMVRTK